MILTRGIGLLAAGASVEGPMFMSRDTDIDPRASYRGRTPSRIGRRQLAGLAGYGLAAAALTGSAMAAPPGGTIKAIAFDAFVTFDPRHVFALAEELFPGKGAALGNLWRIRQFEYTWL